LADPSSSRMSAVERRAQLLASAARVFSTHGYSGTTTAEIARAAGITEPIIYRHFASKRDLFIALIRQTGEQTISDWEDALKRTPDPAERLTGLISANPMVSGKGRVSYRVMVQAMMEVEDAQVRAAIHEHIKALQAFLAKVVEQAQAEGYVSKRFSPDITAWTLIEVALGYGVLAAAHVPGHSTDQATGLNVQDLIGMLMLGERYKREA
jgi:AcrR family transcriptional regulator